MFFYSEEETEISEISGGGSTDPYFSNVSLLLNMDSDFSDSSVYQNSTTTGGGVSISTVDFKYGDGSGYFNGNGDAVTIASSDSLDLSGQDWTIETWIKPNGDYSNWRMILAKRNSSGDYNYQLYLDRYTGELRFYPGGAPSDVVTGVTPQANVWSHVAVVRSNGTVTVYLNGNSVGSMVSDTDFNSAPLGIGCVANGVSGFGGHGFIGYIDDVRITKGVARYTANFTPPTEPHPTQGENTPAPTDPYFYNTSLLLNMDSDFSDSSVYQNSVTTGGNAAVSTTESKFGGGSGYFDGSSGTGLSFSSADQFDLRGVDWTIEAWVNPDGNYNDWRMIVGKKSIDGNTIDYQFYLNKNDQDGNGIIKFYSKTTGLFIKATTAPISNQWNHVAAVRYNGVVTLYLNGQPVGNSTGDVGYSASNPLTIGSPSSLNSFLFTGYIDDVRITKGVARYTTNFTPPTEPHPTTGPSEIATSGMVLELDAENYDTVGYNGGTKTGAANDAIYVGTDEKYFQFNGAGHISFPSNSAYSFGTGAFTIEFWIQGSLARIVQADNTIDSSGTNIWWTGISSTWGAMVNVHGPGGYGFRGGNSYDVNNWGHFVMIRNAGNNMVYLNGQLQSLTLNNIDGISVGQSGIIIGAGTQNAFSTGKIAAVRIYNRALTHVEAVQNFDAAKDRFGL